MIEAKSEWWRTSPLVFRDVRVGELFLATKQHHITEPVSVSSRGGIERVQYFPGHLRFPDADRAESGAVSVHGKHVRHLNLLIDVCPARPDADRERLFSLISDRLVTDVVDFDAVARKDKGARSGSVHFSR